MYISETKTLKNIFQTKKMYEKFEKTLFKKIKA